MYRQMMKRKHPSSSPLLEEGDARRMAEELTRELERGIKLSPESKRPRTIPMHDPFFVGTPEEAALHLQRLERRMKRKSEDVTILNNEMQLQLGSNPQVQEMPNNNRGCKIPRRSRAQASVVDIDALNRKLSTFDLSDTTYVHLQLLCLCHGLATSCSRVVAGQGHECQPVPSVDALQPQPARAPHHH